MQTYIGTKIIQAEKLSVFNLANKIVEGTLKSNGAIDGFLLKNDPDDLCYLVKYPDGYTSISPVDVFEEAYELATGLSYGLAVEAARKGYALQRVSWNDKDEYMFIVAGAPFNFESQLLSDNVNRLLERDMASVIAPHFALKTAAGMIQPGWIASQDDTFGTDWQIVRLDLNETVAGE
jgi:hypothetical protein